MQSTYQQEITARANASKQNYDEHLAKFHALVNGFRKNTKKSDNCLNITSIKTRNSLYDEYIGFIVRYDWRGTIIGKLFFNNFDARVEEIAKTSAKHLDDGVGRNKREKTASTKRLNANEQLAKSIDAGLESYSDSSGIHGKVNDAWFYYSGSEIKVSLYDDRTDQLAKDIAELIRTKYPKKETD